MFNDLKAPRFNSRKFRKNIISEDLYKTWKAKYNRKESYNDFKKVWNLLAEEIIEEILTERDGVRLPSLGDLYIGYITKINKPIIDHQLSMEYGKPIKHMNFDTRGKLGKIILGYKKRKYLFKYKGWWSFVACRNFKRTVSKALKENPERYKNSIEKS